MGFVLERCNDCGEQFKVEFGVKRKSSRPDVCDGCWENRVAFVRLTGNGVLSPEQIATAQRKMAAGRGSAKKYVEGLLHGVTPDDISDAKSALRGDE